jgi:hypothetical protein
MTTSIPAGRIWWLRIHLGTHKKWGVWCGLSEHSLPARAEAIFLVEGQRGGRVTEPPQTLRIEHRLSREYALLVPEE